MNLQRTVAPADPPVDLATVKAHLRLDHADQDTYLGLLLSAAVKELDGPGGILGRCIMTQTWVLRLADFGASVYLPITPLQSLVVEYLDTAGDTQTLAATGYTLHTPFRGLPWVEWDTTVLPGLSEDDDFPVTLTMVGGADAADEAISLLTLMRVAAAYRDPEAAGDARVINPMYDGLMASARLIL